MSGLIAAWGCPRSKIEQKFSESIEITMIFSNNKESDCVIFMMIYFTYLFYKGFKIRDILFTRIWLTGEKDILLAYFTEPDVFSQQVV